MLPIIPPTLRAGTPDLPKLPHWLLRLLLPFLPNLLAWAEQQILRQVLTRCADHFLVWLATRYEPTQAVAACQGFSSSQHGAPGRPPDYSVELLLRAEMVRAWAGNCSDRDLEWHLVNNIIVRWFVGLSLFTTRIPDHTTLSRFHAWMREHAPDALFRPSPEIRVTSHIKLYRVIHLPR